MVSRSCAPTPNVPCVGGAKENAPGCFWTFGIFLRGGEVLEREEDFLARDSGFANDICGINREYGPSR